MMSSDSEYGEKGDILRLVTVICGLHEYMESCDTNSVKKYSFEHTSQRKLMFEKYYTLAII